MLPVVGSKNPFRLNGNHPEPTNIDEADRLINQEVSYD
jgi:hypothetical protein